MMDIEKKTKYRENGYQIAQHLVSVFCEFKEPFLNNYSSAQCKNKFDFLYQFPG